MFFGRGPGGPGGFGPGPGGPGGFGPGPGGPWGPPPPRRRFGFGGGPWGPPPPRRGCYVATAVYGSYDCPQVWILRRYRDNVLDKTAAGRAFIRTYYALSPTFVKWFKNNRLVMHFCKARLDNWTDRLRQEGFSDTPYIDKY